MKWMLLLGSLSLLAAQSRDFQIERAPQRKALVVGNNAYPKQPLLNAVNDAQDLAKALAPLGFSTKLLENADLRQMDLAVRDFAAGLQPGDVALFYFSGHGIAVEGENFLLPVSFAADMEADVRYQALSASRVRDLLKGRNVRLSILILDACRSNPFRNVRSGAGGLSGMSGAGAFIAFAADEGRTADDNPKERNGLFTKHLLRELPTPGLGLEQLFTRVRTRVFEESQGKQIPFSYSGLIGEFSFRAALPPAANPLSSLPPEPPKTAPSEAKLPNFGEKRGNPRDGLRYIFVPPGRSVIGCYPADTCQEGDLAGREVQTRSGFWIGESEVTRDAYAKVMNASPDLRLEVHRKMAPVLQGNLPVTDISPTDAATYCRRVGLRLPTEFEWEFAARAGVSASQPPSPESYAWAAPPGATSMQDLVQRGGYAHAVMQKQPNLWGLYDILGNVAEFTLSADDQTKTVVRGGSFAQTMDKIRYARRYVLPDNQTTYMNFGFRCAGPELP